MYAKLAWSPNGPKLLRWIARQARIRSEGRVMSYRELAVMLRAELEADTRNKERLRRARNERLEALRAGNLTASGKLRTSSVVERLEWLARGNSSQHVHG